MSRFFEKLFLGVKDEDIENIKSKMIFDKTYWDPTGTIDVEKMRSDSARINALYEKIKSNPKRARKQVFAFLLMAVVVFVISILFLPTLFVIIISVFFLLIAGIIYAFYKNLAKDVIKGEIAKSNSWYYDPLPDVNKWKSLVSSYPEIFQKGNENRNIEDQMWGSIIHEKKEYFFYTGIFNYTVVTRDSKGRTNRTTYSLGIFAFNFGKRLSSRFYLYPENVFSKIGNLFTKKEINTESIEFNKTFAFNYKGKRGENELDIVKTLSPAVQTQLLDLNKELNGLSVLFSEDHVFFVGKPFLSRFDTDLVFKTTVSEKDKQKFNGVLHKLIDVGINVRKYLD